MTNINFDEPSNGKVDSSNTPALSIQATGNKMKGLDIEIGHKLDGTVARDTIGIRCINAGVGIAFGIVGQGVVGVQGISESSANAVGVQGKAHSGTGVLGLTDGGNHHHGVVGISAATEGTSAGICGRGKIAGLFEGDVEVTGDIKLLNSQLGDFAEDFDTSEENVEPGTVMVLSENGSLQLSCQKYDKKVAGIVSGAGGYKPAIILGEKKRSDNTNKNKNRLPVALVGKVYCKVDARQSPIETGDLLTTSSTKGYAMKAEDPIKSFGAVMGKALGSLKDGLGLIPVLVTLQ